MKAWRLIGIPIFLALISMQFTGCIALVLRTIYTPVYLPYSELRTKVVSEKATDLGITGKIYVIDNYIFVNELYEGIHVIENSNPSSPKSIAFIPIPGNVDMAAVDNVLYADSYVDLVVIDISDPSKAKEIARVKDAFPYSVPDPWFTEVDFDFDDFYEDADDTIGVVIGWEEAREEIIFQDTSIE